MTPELDKRAALIREAETSRLLNIPAPRSILFLPFQNRACFICGSWEACVHREPELVITCIRGAQHA